MKTKQSFKITALLISIVLIFNGFGILGITSNNISSNETNDYKITFLTYENDRLRNSVNELEKRISKIENNITEVNNYDEYIYSQIIGTDIDTNNFTFYENEYNDSINIRYDSITTNLDRRTKYLSKFVAFELKKIQTNYTIINKNKSILDLYPNISPIKTKDFIEISSGFGWRKHPVYHTPIFHDGVDITAIENTKVYATMNGKVDNVLYSRIGYGNRVVIKNSHGYEILYAHLSESIYVKVGQKVEKGQLIATTGNTGLSTGPHLHYEIHKNDELKDPLSYFYVYLNDNLISENIK